MYAHEISANYLLLKSLNPIVYNVSIKFIYRICFRKLYYKLSNFKSTRMQSTYIFLLQDNFYIIVETYHKEGRGDEDNVHELDNKKLKERTVVNIDIANDPVDANDYKKDEDPKTFKSEKTGRGPLDGDWKVRNKLIYIFHIHLLIKNFYILEIC